VWEDAPMARVLLALADASQRASLAGALRAAGHTVFLAADAQECLGFLGQRPPDVLVLDPALPRLVSVGLLRRVREPEVAPEMKLLFLGGVLNPRFWESVVAELTDGVVDRGKPEKAVAAVAEVLGLEAPAPAAAPAAPAAPPPAAAPPKRNILVVESVARYGLTLGLEFDAKGWNATCAGTGEFALEECGREKVDAILADLDLSGMKGDELARQIRTRHPAVKILLMTDLPKDKWPASVPADVPVLPKPISVDLLLHAMRFMRMKG
jgi:DNA-binding response OmpR family regulator